MFAIFSVLCYDGFVQQETSTGGCPSAYIGRKGVRHMSAFETIMVILTFIDILVVVILSLLKK